MMEFSNFRVKMSHEVNPLFIMNPVYGLTARLFVADTKSTFKIYI